MNAAVWLGGAFFFTFAAAPALFAPESKRLLGEAQTGIVAQLVLERYFIFQYWCGSIAVIHQLAEWVYLGRALQRLTIGVLMGVFGLALVGGVWLQPKLQKLHQIKYSYRRTEQGYVKDDTASATQRAQADKTFRKWHGASMVINLFVLGGLTFFTWRVAHPADGPRFIPANKFRG